MSNLLKIHALRADLGAARGMLVAARQYHDALATRQFEYRVQMLQAYLDEAIDAEDPVAIATFFFDGGPNVNGRGIDVSFAGKALERFRAALARQFVSTGSFGEGLEKAVVDQVESSMTVTARVRGSVALVLEEEPKEEGPLPGLPAALEELAVVLSQIAAEDEAWMAAPQFVDAQVLKAVNDWFVLLDDASASVRIVEGKRDFILSTEGVARARARLALARCL